MVHKSRVTNNVRSYADTARFLVVMKAWRYVLFDVSKEQVSMGKTRVSLPI